MAARGSRVRHLKTDDEVYSYSWANRKGGFYAEYVVVPADKVGHVPKHLDLDHAGAIATTGLTALQGIDDALRLKRGETIIIHGASGGVGTLAIQFAKLRCCERVPHDRRPTHRHKPTPAHNGGAPVRASVPCRGRTRHR